MKTVTAEGLLQPPPLVGRLKWTWDGTWPQDTGSRKEQGALQIDSMALKCSLKLWKIHKPSSNSSYTLCSYS